MKMKVTQQVFVDTMRARSGKFSEGGLVGLFNYLESIEEPSPRGTEMEFDPGGIEQSYTEYSSVEEAFEDITGKEATWEVLREIADFEDEYVVSRFSWVRVEGNQCGVIIRNI